MKTKLLFTGLLVIMLAACDNTASRLAAAAERCALELSYGILEGAEKSCTEALGGDDEDVLEPEVRSARLYELARIKRQLSRYTEGEDLIRQSLAIEEGLSGANSTAVGLRLLELSLDLAGQGRWDEGARVIERTLPLTGGFTGDERASMVRIVKQYARQLEMTGQTGLAERFRVAAAELESQQARK